MLRRRVKMKKTILFIFFLLIPVANAIDVCKDTPKISTPCMMLTPEIARCDKYTYEVFYANVTTEAGGHSITDGNLSVYNGNIYYFNFTEAGGDYLIRLCDGGTREIIVDNDDNEFYLYIFSVLAFLGFLGLGYYLKDGTFVILSGMLSIIIAVNLFVNGFPDLTSEFLRDGLVAVMLGLGFYFILNPTIEELEERGIFV